jgi:hypothetical protein
MRIPLTQRLLMAVSLLAGIALPCPAALNPSPLRDAVILVIRHAEKPESGVELAPTGFQRADAYVNYFKTFQIDGQPLKLDHLFAAADSKNSHRPHLTLAPLSRALKLPLDLRFKDKHSETLGEELRARPHGQNMLICWHHTAIPDLLRALGADPDKLLPDGKWPPDVFNWVLELRYDHYGKLRPNSRRVTEPALP